MEADVIKQTGKRTSETFSRPKLHASIVAACLSVRSPEGEAEQIAHSVCEQVIAWLAQKPEVTSNDIRQKAGDALSILHPEAAYLYKHHQLVF